MSEKPTCAVCGEPMPAGEEMFQYHGYSGPCPKPPKPADKAFDENVEAISNAISERNNLKEALQEIARYRMPAADTECRVMLHIAIELAKHALECVR